MQNIHVFRHSSEIQRFFHGLWKTEYFRDQHATRGTYIHEVMHRVARYPLFIYTMSEHPSADVALRERTEAKHFSPWWGGIVRYELDHPLTHDLCWLHDLAHRAYAQYDPAASFESFSVRTRALERKATIISNLVPYLDRPSLRTMIDEPLLVDRFLQDSQFMMLWHLARDTAWQELDDFLALSAKDHASSDALVRQVAIYGQINEAWLELWKKRFREVEGQMARLHARVDKEDRWDAAIEEWQQWLKASAADNNAGIPFLPEAVSFSKRYLEIYPG